MAKPFTISLSHRLGKDEATRRVQSGLSTVRNRFSSHITIAEERWTDSHLEFRINALGKSATGTLEISEERMILCVELPLFLNLLARKATARIEKEGQLLLEKK